MNSERGFEVGARTSNGFISIGQALAVGSSWYALSYATCTGVCSSICSWLIVHAIVETWGSYATEVGVLAFNSQAVIGVPGVPHVLPSTSAPKAFISNPPT